MSRVIAFDSGPLSLVTQRFGSPEADHCRQWADDHQQRGAILVVPEIADYEVRRELLRAGKIASVRRLDLFLLTPGIRYLGLNTQAMRLAAQLWADVRNRGLPTTDRFALDADVILAAQILSAGYPVADLVIATSNVGHLSRFCPARQWDRI